MTAKEKLGSLLSFESKRFFFDIDCISPPLLAALLPAVLFGSV